MFYFIFVLCCKDTTKSNNYQVFKGKSYYIVHYLTFLNRKIKYYYLFTYYLLYYYYYILYVSYYIIYLIIYRERTKANGKGRAAPRRSAILPASSSSPSSSPPSGGEGRAASQPGRAILCLFPRRPSPPCRGGCLGIRLLSSSYHLRIKAIPGRRVLFFKRGKAPKYFFSAYQFINLKTRSWYEIWQDCN